MLASQRLAPVLYIIVIVQVAVDLLAPISSAVSTCLSVGS